MSYPVPEFWSRLPFRMPYMIPTIERIMITSIATASALITERRGRYTRFPKTSLFMDRGGVPHAGALTQHTLRALTRAPWQEVRRHAAPEYWPATQDRSVAPAIGCRTRAR